MPAAKSIDPQRSRTMAAVRSRDTGPEILVRSLLFRLGYRFRLHRADLPGSPDIVLPKYKAAIFVHGCFWHGHDCQRGSRVPKSNRQYWLAKIDRNRTRDRRNIRKLRRLGWKVLIVWECSLNSSNLTARLKRHLVPRDSRGVGARS
ncbi:MAG: very short patch repair endonuclease [Planctomycetales bacterium 12-60-4]|nr:MAG: very short patch repair endonuclease [Planctomycetales bacterium 12-60-4]